jgi:hypothetical protein
MGENIHKLGLNENIWLDTQNDLIKWKNKKLDFIKHISINFAKDFFTSLKKIADWDNCFHIIHSPRTFTKPYEKFSALSFKNNSIQLWYIVRTFINSTLYSQYNNNKNKVK